MSLVKFFARDVENDMSATGSEKAMCVARVILQWSAAELATSDEIMETVADYLSTDTPAPTVRAQQKQHAEKKEQKTSAPESTPAARTDALKQKAKTLDSKRAALAGTVARFDSKTVQKASTAGKKTVTVKRSPGSAPVAKGGATPTDVRAWLNENGFEISDRGRIPNDYITAYNDNH